MKWIFGCVKDSIWQWDIRFINNKRDLHYILHLFLYYTSLFSFRFFPSLHTLLFLSIKDIAHNSWQNYDETF